MLRKFQMALSKYEKYAVDLRMELQVPMVYIPPFFRELGMSLLPVLPSRDTMGNTVNRRAEYDDTHTDCRRFHESNIGVQWDIMEYDMYIFI